MEIEKSLLNHFSIIVDPRIERTKKHKLLDILVITICAVLSDCDSWTDIADWAEENVDWFSSFLDLSGGIPSHDTFARVFSILNPEDFQTAFFEWIKEIKKELPNREIINIDGKFIRGSKQAYSSRNAIIMVSAWASGAGISLGQLTSRLKKDEGEKKTIEKLLDCIDVKNNIITLDANGASLKIVEKITSKKGDYTIALKDNQRAGKRLTTILFEKNIDNILHFSSEEKGHGRKEKRVYELLNLKASNQDGIKQGVEENILKFKNINSLGRVTATRELNGVTSIEIRYYITSLININEFSKSVREHWAIENCLHWQLDVTFKEDHMRARIGHSAENLATIRRMALNMLKQDGTEKRSLRRKRKLCSWRKDYLLKIIFGANFEI